jgi:hypothetical protein
VGYKKGYKEFNRHSNFVAAKAEPFYSKTVVIMKVIAKATGAQPLAALKQGDGREGDRRMQQRLPAERFVV